MSLNIKNEEAERLARGLANATGESVTRAVTVALQERLARLNDQETKDLTARIARIQAIAEDAADRWKEPYRSMDHGDLLYDESGLPR
jgi:antitoxin VapB